jgi:large subunit ribosomal protein L25
MQISICIFFIFSYTPRDIDLSSCYCLLSIIHYLFFMHALEAKIRTEIARDTRASGAIPAVVYGKDVPSMSISVGVSEFIKVFRSSGKNHVITLKVEKKSHSVLVHDTQRHPVTWAFLHLDFLTIDMNAQVHIQIPIKLVGTSPAVVEGGQLHQSLAMLDVKCLPADIVDAFELDISAIDHVGKVLHVSDLVVDSKKFTVMSHSEEAIASVHAVKEAKEETEEKSVADVAVATAKADEAKSE